MLQLIKDNFTALMERMDTYKKYADSSPKTHPVSY